MELVAAFLHEARESVIILPMLKMRLQRVGRKNDPSFRIVVLEGTEGPKSGNHVDQIGFYNAVTKQKALDKEKAKQWLAKGVQPSDTVYNFLVTEGVIDGKKKNVLPKKSPIIKEEAPVAPEASTAPQASESVTEAPEAKEAEVIADEALEASVEPAPVVAEAMADEPEAEVVAEAPAEVPVEETPAA